MKLATTIVLAGTVMTGCATTQATSTRTAPITYKIGQGDAQFASIERTPRIEMPRSHDMIGGQGRDFDPDKIDRNLYRHQKVGKRYTVMGQTFTPKHDPDYDRTGVASWYGPKFHGKPTANGEVFDRHAMTAAHPTLPLNSMVRVTNLENGKTVTVRLNDRGPFVNGRLIDLSEAAAKALDYKQQGTTKVRVRYIGPTDPMASHRRKAPSAPRLAELPMENLTPAPAPYLPPIIPQRPPAALPQPMPQAQAPVATPLPAPSPAMPRRAPQADLPDGDITLTIKGPIHIARSDDATASPRFIREPAITQAAPTAGR
ncbi:MAG: septal ring lytic transglycosylase RlpA family protein [Pseudomonadota bacterium]